MKVAHWTFFNGSGLANMAAEMAEAEKPFGVDVVICDTQKPATWAAGMDADIHVVHSHVPDAISFDKTKKLVDVQHGSPEHTFELSVTQGLYGAYGASDSLAVSGFLLKRADAVVSMWERQAYLLESMTRTKVYTIPMGVDTKFWTPVPKQNLLSGKPSVLTGENSHTCKWPVDIMFTWGKIAEQLHDARLHAINVPHDQHKWWFPLAYMTNTMYSAYVSGFRCNKNQLRDFFCAADYYYSPVEYGDHNRVSLEAAACGTKVISYRGNQWAHYWITEGDQRIQVQEMLAILKGETKPREVPKVPDITETAEAMLKVYEEVLRK